MNVAAAADRDLRDELRLRSPVSAPPVMSVSMNPGATELTVTPFAISHMVDVATKLDGWRNHLGDLRRAISPWDTVGDTYEYPARDARIPSRTKSIEELPVALGLLVACGGDYTESVLGAVNYGRDSDSIAVMAGTIAGALGGRGVVPTEWVKTVSQTAGSI